MFGKDTFKTLLAAGAVALVAGGAGAATVLIVDDTYAGVTPFAGTATDMQSDMRRTGFRWPFRLGWGRGEVVYRASAKRRY